MANFITVTDQTGRNSSLAIDARGANDKLVVIGVLPHCSEIRPSTTEDAQKLLDWLVREFPFVKTRS